MRATRSPLELLDGHYEHALLTTYSFNLRFFEEAVLRALWAAEVRSVVVFVDRRQLGEALSDRAPSHAGRAYHLVATGAARAAFHPKLILLTGGQGARLSVSSANLTADGMMRNAESVIAFDSHMAGHTRPILDGGELFRRLSEHAPAHTAEAIQRTLARLPDDQFEHSPFRLVHNLDSPLLAEFPRGDSITAIAPFVDANGAAARALSDRGPLTVIVDGEHIAASEAFFAGPWTVDSRRFTSRMHGKAYEARGQTARWVLISSPNLSTPALLSSAEDGNLEVAVAIADGAELELPTGEPWHDETLAAHAAARLTADRRDRQAGTTTWAFDAWEEELRIRVDGVPDGSVLQRWAAERWLELGTVIDGQVLLTDPDVRPTRVRALLPSGSFAHAVVAQPARLRLRMRAPTGGRHTEAVKHLPLDIETVRALEEALSQLYVLSEIVGDAPQPARASTRGQGTRDDDEGGLLGWMPRTADEEPRVPPVYMTAWQGEPDALLALIGRVLRLDEPSNDVAEEQVGPEGVELEQLGEITGEVQIDVEKEREPPAVERRPLERYRRALRALLERGGQFVSSSRDPILAGWAFSYLMVLLEDLGAHSVRIEQQTEPLMPHTALSAIRLDLLERYLGRGEHDPVCLATARAHLAAAIRERHRYSTRDEERLDTLAYAWAAELIGVHGDLPSPDEQALGLGVGDAALWLDDYAQRSQWQAIERHAGARLDPVWLQLQPWPTIIGQAAFVGRLQSPRWDLMAFAAPAGYASGRPFAIIARNDGIGPLVTHALVCDPKSGVLVEAFERASDGVWVVRRYRAASREVLERVHSPIALEPLGPGSDLIDLGDAEEPLRTLAPLLRAIADALR
jgi:hypothetical protein